jgi:dipeptidyl aminopeptidase/acylaminoacyl peptidase
MKQRLSLFFLFLLTACQSASISSTRTLPPPTAVIETATPSPVPTDTFTPSPTPTTEELIFPYTIDGLRQHNYQSGEVHIRSTLEETEKYTSYLIDYPSDGLTITGVMNIPKGDGKFPVIVMNHGFFARSVYSSGDGTDRSSAFLAEHGYITLASDYRTWGGSDVGDSYFYSGLAVDVINLLDAIPSVAQADPQRVGIWGHSMGGGVTMKVLAIMGGRADPNASDGRIETAIKAAVLYSTVSADQEDVIERWGMGCVGDIAAGEQVIGCNSSDIVDDELPINFRDAYRFASQDSVLLREISPFYHLDAITVPIQIHYGTEDGKALGGTPPEWSVKLTQALRDAGKPVEVYEYGDQGHSFIGQPWFDFMIRTLRFFDHHVRNTG